MKTMEIELKTDADYQRWAWEALVNYASYRVKVREDESVLKVVPMPKSWHPGDVPILDDLWESNFKFDFEQHDYLVVRGAIAEQTKKRPMDYILPDLLTHCLLRGLPVSEFEFHLPFQTRKSKMGDFGRGACNNAWQAVAELMRAVTELKRQQNSQNLEKTA